MVNNKENHIAMLFDGSPSNRSLSAIRSIAYFSKEPVSFHFVLPKQLHLTSKNLSFTLPDSVKIYTYDLKLCTGPVSLLSYAAQNSSLSSLCKLFLSEIIPAEYVLYVDRDVIATADLQPCFLHINESSRRTPSFGTSAIMGMGVDMDDRCLMEPQKCHPIGMKIRAPPNLECGAKRLDSKIIRNRKLCYPSSRDFEPFLFNSGVVLMNLNRMRTTKFTARLVQATVYLWRSQKQFKTTWEEQDLLNNYIRLYPKSVVTLPCGCNYQYTAVLRETKCPNKTIVIAHGTRSMRYSKHFNPIDKFFFYFQRSDIDFTRGESINPPGIPQLSSIPKAWIISHQGLNKSTYYNELLPVIDSSCSFQTHNCSVHDVIHVQKLSIQILGDKVNILSRLFSDTSSFSDLSKSIQKQTHPRLAHIIGIDDLRKVSNSTKTYPFHVVKFRSHSEQFDAMKVCKLCISSNGSCYATQKKFKFDQLASFLTCFCNSGYLPNQYMNDLHREVDDGWILYLNDDKLFAGRFAISSLLAAIKSRNTVVTFRSVRSSTSRQQFWTQELLNGVFGESNFAFHSSNLKFARWPPLYCGEQWVRKMLLSHINVQKTNLNLISPNPSFSENQVPWLRALHSFQKVTVIITSYSVNGWRPNWVMQMIKEYISSKLQDLVAKVILVWNNPHDNVPQQILELNDSMLEIVQMTRNSLNNRWTKVLDFVNTNMVLNLDDDVYVTRDGLICMMSWSQIEPGRLIAPYVRKVIGAKYLMKGLFDSGPYSMALPRVLLLPTSVLHNYANRAHKAIHEYVDSHDAHCDDVLLNVVAQDSQITPLRVALPRHTVVDFFLACMKVDKRMTAGLGLQSNRSAKRSECVSHILNHFQRDRMISVGGTATCSSAGSPFGLKEEIHIDKYKSMIDFSRSLYCEKKK